MTTLRVACAQMRARATVEESCEVAARLVAEAAAVGAELVLLPEKWNALGEADALAAAAERVPAGPCATRMAGWARDQRVVLVGGSITEMAPDGDTLFNTTPVYDATGAFVGRYRKVHLFDVDVEGHRYRESDAETAGDQLVAVEVGDCLVGLSICYDVRFPEQFQALASAGCRAIVVPAAFTSATGRDHWEVLLRARAIETQCFVIAAGQWGAREGGKTSYGHSMIVDPWGTILAQVPDDDDAVIVASLDLELLDDIRGTLPSLFSRKPHVYRDPVHVLSR